MAQDDSPLVTIFSTSQVDVIPVIKSLLRGAEIPFTVEGEAMMNLYPSDLLGPLLGKSSGEVRFKVPPEHADEARQLIEAPVESVPELEEE